MDFLLYKFSVSELETYIFVPTLASFCISLLFSPGGTTGAFLLIPFQISVFGINSLSVTATNFIYNFIAIPLGFSYKLRKHEMFWPLFLLFLIGSSPGLFLGYFIRIKFLKKPEDYKFFVGIVLLLLVFGALKKFRINSNKNQFSEVKYSWKSFGKLNIFLDASTYCLKPVIILFISILTGIIGGIYGIGGGAVLASFSILILNLPPVLISGSTLFITWINSILGVFIYYIDPFKSGSQVDFLLGTLFGLGGLVGVYLGQKIQKIIPQIFIKILYVLTLIFLSAKYLFFKL